MNDEQAVMAEPKAKAVATKPKSTRTAKAPASTAKRAPKAADKPGSKAKPTSKKVCSPLLVLICTTAHWQVSRFEPRCIS